MTYKFQQKRVDLIDSLLQEIASRKVELYANKLMLQGVEQEMAGSIIGTTASKEYIKSIQIQINNIKQFMNFISIRVNTLKNLANVLRESLDAHITIRAMDTIRRTVEMKDPGDSDMYIEMNHRIYESFMHMGELWESSRT